MNHNNFEKLKESIINLIGKSNNEKELISSINFISESLKKGSINNQMNSIPTRKTENKKHRVELNKVSAIPINTAINSNAYTLKGLNIACQNLEGAKINLKNFEKIDFSYESIREMRKEIKKTRKKLIMLDKG